MIVKNVYSNINELIKDYYSQPVANYLNQTVTINGVSLDCDIYRVANNSELTASVFTGCVAEDANTQIIIGSNLSVADGTTLTPPYRCKGIIIGCPGTFTNAGIISMTARGASGAGKNIQLTDDYMISAVGGAGGSSVKNANGATGSTAAANVLSCAGGGSGGSTKYSNTDGNSGAGGSGTSFSGGAGGGGANHNNGTDGSSTGGAGGTGGVHSASYGDETGGGAGNPGGAGNGSYGSENTNKGSDGTGGLLVIFSNNLVQSGTLTSNGSAGGNASEHNCELAGAGGGSGAGCIVLLSNTSNISGTYTVDGGTGGVIGTKSRASKGGDGGAGTYANLTVEDLVLVDPTELQLALTVKSALDNIEPVSGRLIGLIDDDELMYEYQGTRHKAVNTDVDLSVIHAPGTAHNATDGSPVGTVISFFGYTAPSGYLVCDGTEYAKADYPYLATHLADLDDHYSTTKYVGSDSDHFKVPDLRGEFLRGTGTNSHSDQGSGANVGVHQDGTQHTFFYAAGNEQDSLYWSNNAGSAGGIRNTADYLGTKGTKFNNAKRSSTDTAAIESYYISRPTNTSVLYCIKCN